MALSEIYENATHDFTQLDEGSYETKAAHIEEEMEASDDDENDDDNTFRDNNDNNADIERQQREREQQEEMEKRKTAMAQTLAETLPQILAQQSSGENSEEANNVFVDGNVPFSQVRNASIVLGDGVNDGENVVDSGVGDNAVGGGAVSGGENAAGGGADIGGENPVAGGGDSGGENAVGGGAVSNPPAAERSTSRGEKEKRKAGEANDTVSGNKKKKN